MFYELLDLHDARRRRRGPDETVGPLIPHPAVKRRTVPTGNVQEAERNLEIQMAKMGALVISPRRSLTLPISLPLRRHPSECSEPMHSSSVHPIKTQASASSDISGPV